MFPCCIGKLPDLQVTMPSNYPIPLDLLLYLPYTLSSFRALSFQFIQFLPSQVLGFPASPPVVPAVPSFNLLRRTWTRVPRRIEHSAVSGSQFIRRVRRMSHVARMGKLHSAHQPDSSKFFARPKYRYDVTPHFTTVTASY